MIVLAVAWFEKTWMTPTTSMVGVGSDGYGVLWAFAWFPFALAHGIDPLFSHYVWFPSGTNLMWDPCMPLVALLVSPITVMAGPVFAYNVVATAAPAMAGWAAYLAFRRWVAPVPALVGALVFGFSPSMAAQSTQHLFLTFLVTVPLLLIVGDRLLVVQGAPAWRDGVWLGLLISAQLLVSEEVLTMEILIVLPVLVVLLVANRGAIAGRLGHALRGLAVGIGVAAVLSAGPLAEQFLGSQRPGQLHPSDVFVTDLWSFVTPSRTTEIYPASAQALSTHITGNWTEWGSYVGIPMLLFLALAIVLCHRRRVAWVALVVTLVAGVLSLGGSLHVAGHDTHVPLPWAIFDGLPVIDNLLPIRFSMIIFLGVGLLLALGLQELPSRPLVTRMAGYGLGIVAVVTIFPVAPYQTKVIPALDAAALRHICPARSGADVALLPSIEEYVVAWEAEAHFCFTIASRSSLTGVAVKAAPLLQQISTDASLGRPIPVLTPALRAQITAQLRGWHATEVVIGPSAAPSLSNARSRLRRWVSRLLGQPPAVYGNILVWAHAQVSPTAAGRR